MRLPWEARGIRLFRRVQAVLRGAEGCSVSEAARQAGLDRTSLHRWINLGRASIEPDRGSGEINGGEKVSCGLVITGGDGAELFEFTKEILDAVARSIQVFVIVTLRFAIRLRRNHGRFARLCQRL